VRQHFIFLYVGTEAAAYGWAATYAKRLAAPIQTLWMFAQSIFWAGLLSSRALAPMILRRLSARRLIMAGLPGRAGKPLRGLRSPRLFESKQRRKDHDHHARPDRVDGEVYRLPTLQLRERHPPGEEPRVEHARPAEVHQKYEIFTEGRDLVGAEAELRDASGDRPKRDDVNQQGANYEEELQGVERPGRLLRVPRRDA